MNLIWQSEWEISFVFVSYVFTLTLSDINFLP